MNGKVFNLILAANCWKSDKNGGFHKFLNFQTLEVARALNAFRDQTESYYGTRHYSGESRSTNVTRMPDIRVQFWGRERRLHYWVESKRYVARCSLKHLSGNSSFLHDYRNWRPLVLYANLCVGAVEGIFFVRYTYERT